MTLTAVQYGDPVLREVAKPIHEIDDEVLSVRTLMFHTLTEYGPRAAGIAANQVGSPLAMFSYWDQDEEMSFVINPRITESDGKWTFNEGCLSLPGIFFQIVRPDRILLNGQDLDGNDIEIEADQLLGRIFQHEMDHMQGKLIIDRVPPGKKKTEALRKLGSITTNA